MYKQLSQPYDYKVLIEAYINSRRKPYPHEDFPNYYKNLLNVLEKLFNVSFDPASHSFKKRILVSYFNTIVKSILAQEDPDSICLEGGLLVTVLEESGCVGKDVLDKGVRVRHMEVDLLLANREMLYSLFNCIFGETTAVFTSEDIKKLGVDDSKEPIISDYYDYM